MNHIELFAGCGGLSLGLEAAGFNLLLANELSPMASETFARNLLNVDLDNLSNTDKVLWLSSEHKKEDLKKRLLENPMTAAGLRHEHYSDLKDKKISSAQLKRSLVVGSITDLNKVLETDSGLLNKIKTGLGRGEVDLISGGPPCQSFSMAGLRDHSNHRNTLPWEFAKFVAKIQPKISILENVSGILRAFNVEGKKHYAWIEVAKAFAEVDYFPLCLHVNAKYVGAAQNRPRFILLALRRDIFSKVKKSKLEVFISQALAASEAFVKSAKGGEEIHTESIRCYDIEKDSSLFDTPVFKHLLTNDKSQLVSVKEAIDDLRTTGVVQSSYVKNINKTFRSAYSNKNDKHKNHAFRANGPKVRARFRLNQVLNRLDSTAATEIKKYINYKNSILRRDVVGEIRKHWLLDIDGKVLKNGTYQQVANLMFLLRTHKHSQRALFADRPAPAIVGIPDDISHYDESKASQRTLTVRELARIQSFPDWFEFKSKVTTGGHRRRFEVPQYTQVGNAVPPLLGFALGRVCKEIIRIAK
jgi:DNA (cytosine-5)-methyltransferase 1